MVENTTDNPPAADSNIAAMAKAASERSGALGVFGPQIADMLRDAAAEFALAPDDWQDVKRLPDGVTNLSSLIDHLRNLKDQLSKKDPKQKMEDFDMTKKGLVRQYKVFCCAIHAVSGYLQGNPDYAVSASVFAAAVITRARGNEPTGMAEAGKTMWSKTFEPTNARTLSVVKTVIYLCGREPADGGDSGEPGGPDPLDEVLNENRPKGDGVPKTDLADIFADDQPKPDAGRLPDESEKDYNKRLVDLYEKMRGLAFMSQSVIQLMTNHPVEWNAESIKYFKDGCNRQDQKALMKLALDGVLKGPQWKTMTDQEKKEINPISKAMTANNYKQMVELWPKLKTKKFLQEWRKEYVNANTEQIHSLTDMDERATRIVNRLSLTVEG